MKESDIEDFIEMMICGIPTICRFLYRVVVLVLLVVLIIES